MRLQKTWRLAASCMLSVALLAGCGGSDLGPEPTFTLQLLHISDADGSDTTALNSIASLSGLVHRFRNQYPQQTLLVSSGDNYIPGPRFNAANDSSLTSLLGKPEVGRADIASLNALACRCPALGGLRRHGRGRCGPGLGHRPARSRPLASLGAGFAAA